MQLQNREGVPYDVALFVKRFYEDKLIENTNIGHIKIVPINSIEGEEHNLFIIEVGVYNTNIKKERKHDAHSKSANLFDLDEYNTEQSIPSYLTIPNQIDFSKKHILPDNIAQNSNQKGGKIRLNTDIIKRKKVRVVTSKRNVFMAFPLLKKKKKYKQESVQIILGYHNAEPSVLS